MLDCLSVLVLFSFWFSLPPCICHCDSYLSKQCNGNTCLFWLRVSVDGYGSIVSGPVVRQSITAEGCGGAKLLISIGSEKQREKGARACSQ